jgi:hypothetical protein
MRIGGVGIRNLTGRRVAADQIHRGGMALGSNVVGAARA